MPHPLSAPTPPYLRSRLLRRPLGAAAALATGYAVVAVTYILLSSSAAATVAGSTARLQAIEETKGVVFVIVTGALLFGLTWMGLRRIAAHELEAAAHAEALTMAENRAMAGMLASSVAHDIRNALSVTSSEIELLLESPSLGAGDRAALDAVVAANDRVVDLTRRLSQLGGDRMTAEPHQTFDLSQALRELVTICRHHRAIRHHPCTVVGLDTPRPMTGNSHLIARAVTNLMVNAGEATPEGGRLQLSLAEVEPGLLEISMEDSGPGIPVEERERVFAPFHTTKPEGTGVGLLSVLLCAEHHGGTTRVEDSPLGGARFVLSLRQQSTASGS